MGQIPISRVSMNDIVVYRLISASKFPVDGTCAGDGEARSLRKWRGGHIGAAYTMITAA